MGVKYIKMILLAFAFRILLLTFLIAGMASVSFSQQKSDDILRFGYSLELFVDVNLNDAKALTNVLSQKLINKRKIKIKDELRKQNIYLLKSETYFFRDSQTMIEMIKNKQVDVMILSPVDYYKLKDKNLVKPLFTSSNSTDGLFRFLVIVKQNSTIKGLDDLKQKRMVYISKFVSLLQNWIISKISNTKPIEFDQYFASNKKAEKSNQALLQVLFGQADACIIDDQGFNVSSEMNPQLKTKLKIVEKSPGFPRGIICLRADYESKILSNQIIDVLSNIHNEPDGQQILKLFNVNKLISFNNDVHKNLNMVMNDVEKLKKIKK